MQKKKLELNPPKTAEQLKFESQWKAGGSKDETQSKPPEVPKPQTSTVQPTFNPPPPTFDNSQFQVNSFDDIQYFGAPERESFRPMDFAASISSGGIPGLDFIPEPEPEPEPAPEPVIDLDVEDMVDPKVSPPPLPKFVSVKRRRPFRDISEIIDQPGRSKRAEK